MGGGRLKQNLWEGWVNWKAYTHTENKGKQLLFCGIILFSKLRQRVNAYHLIWFSKVNAKSPQLS